MSKKDTNIKITRYHIIYLVDSKETVYDLLTEEEFERKTERNQETDEFWETWNSAAFDIELPALRKACKKRKISQRGMVIPFPSGGGFDNFYYQV